MQNEKELRAQAQQQFQDYMQKKQQELGRELSDEDLEKIAGGMSGHEALDKYIQYCIRFDLKNWDGSLGSPLSFDDWVSSNGYSINWF